MSQKQSMAFEILKHMAIYNDTEQAEFPKILGCSYRTILREIKLLELGHYISFVRNRPLGERGRPRNVWKITFFGLLTVIKQFVDKYEPIPDVIIQNFKNDWIIFKEWEYLTKDDRIKKFVESSISMFLIGQNFSIEELNEARSDYRRPGFFTDEDDKREYKEGRKWSEVYWKIRIAQNCLGLNYLLDSSLSNDDEDIKWILRKYLIYCLKNPRLQQFIENQLKELYEIRFQRYLIVRNILDEFKTKPPSA